MDISCQVPPITPPNNGGGNTNTPPELSAIPSQQCEVGGQITYQLQATDADGDSLSYSFTPATSGVSISSTGLVTINCLATGLFNITVTVSDGNGGADSEQFNWIVSDEPIDECELYSQPKSNPKRVAFFDDPNTSDGEEDWKMQGYVQAYLTNYVDFRMYGINRKTTQTNATAYKNSINAVYDLADPDIIIANCPNVNLLSTAEIKSRTYVGGTFETGSNNSTTPVNGKSTPASNKLKAEILASTASDPLYVLVGGPPVDIAQALFELETSNPNAYKNVRLFSVGNYNTGIAGVGANDYLFDTFLVANPDFWWVDSSSWNVYPNVPPNPPSENIRTFAGLTTNNWTGCNVNAQNDSFQVMTDLQAIRPNFVPSLSQLNMGDFLPWAFILSDELSKGALAGDCEDPTVLTLAGDYIKWDAGMFPNYYVDPNEATHVNPARVCSTRGYIFDAFRHVFGYTQ